MAYGAAQKIERAWLHGHRRAIPFAIVPLATETQSAGREKRKGQDILKDGLVAMPADAGAGSLYSVTVDCSRELGGRLANSAATARKGKRNSGSGSLFCKARPE